MRTERTGRAWNLRGKAGDMECWRNNGKSDGKGGLGTLVWGIIWHAKELECYSMGSGNLLMIWRLGHDTFRAVFMREIFASNLEPGLEGEAASSSDTRVAAKGNDNKGLK